MLQEPREKILNRSAIYAKYFSTLEEMENRNISEEFSKDIKEAQIQFKGKTKLEVKIKGIIEVGMKDKILFTFLNKTYNINTEGLEQALRDLDDFDTFCRGNKEGLYFSEIENEYINYTRVLNAQIRYELT